MTKTERIIKNVDATMSMEDMPLTRDDKKRLQECLDGEVSFNEAIARLVKKYAHA